MSFTVVTTPDAEEHIRTVDSWWRENRTAAPNPSRKSLPRSSSCESTPYIGRSYRHETVRDVRRILLRSSRYHVYYVVCDDAVIVLSVWSAVRGSGPDLTAL